MSGPAPPHTPSLAQPLSPFLSRLSWTGRGQQLRSPVTAVKMSLSCTEGPGTVGLAPETDLLLLEAREMQSKGRGTTCRYPRVRASVPAPELLQAGRVCKSAALRP